MKGLLIVTLFCLWCMFITVHAQFDDDINFGDYVPCPENLIKFYSNCRGSLDQCSTCLGQAEKKCEDADKAGAKTGACYQCTSQAAGNCNNVKPMCSGNQECGGGDYKCVDRECVYVSPS